MKKFLKYIPFQILICLVIGILCGNFIEIKPHYLIIIYGVLVILFISIYIYSKKQFNPSFGFSGLVFMLSFFIGFWAITFKNQQHQAHYFANQVDFSESRPHTAILCIQKVLKPTLYAQKYEAIILQMDTKYVSGKILVNIQKDSVSKPLNVDDEILVRTFFSELPKAKNPFEFNYKNYLKHQQIFYQIYIPPKQFLVLDKTTTIKGFAARAREKINIALIQNNFKDNELAVINALLLGQRQDISDDLMQNYVGAGAIHILAVSGLHVGIILLILTFLFKPLHHFKNGKLIASVLILILLWLFAILAGLSASVIRAVAMFSAIAIGMYSNRASNVNHALVISMFFLLLFNPNYLFEVGFQLSYLAVFAIVWIQPKLYELWQPKIWVADKFWQLLTVSIAAQIGVLPLSLYYFHQFPGLFFVSNLLIIPFLGIILILGISVILLSLFGILPVLLADIYVFMIQQMNHFIAFIGSQQFFIIENISFSFLLLLSCYAFIFFFFKWTENKNYSRALLVLSSIIVIQLVFIYEAYDLKSSENFIVFHKSKQSILAKRDGEKLVVSTSISDFSIHNNPINSYIVGKGIKDVMIEDNPLNLQIFKDETILVIDSLGLYNFKTIKPTIVILRQSPKINLDRLLTHLKPTLVVSDGSNYKSYTTKWEQSCLENNTPFYNTFENGAFILK